MRTETKELDTGVDIVYNLYESLSGLYLANAYLVNRDKLGMPAHILQRATPETVGSFNLQVHETQVRLFQLLEEMKETNLQKRFSPPRKKGKDLEVLWEEEEIQIQILHFVQRRMDELLRLVCQHRLLLTWSINRRVLVKDFLVKLGQETLQPHLAFHRDEAGVRYRLTLSTNGKAFLIQKREITPVSNTPGWLLVDHVLYPLSQINGNMVKPFLTKDEIRIPAKSVKSYFQKFIIKVAGQLDFEATGFSVLQSDRLTGCRLDLAEHLFGEGKVLQVKMMYAEAAFSWYDKRDKKAGLSFQGEEVTVTQITRNFDAENVFLEKLCALGLKVLEGTGVWQLEEEESPADPYSLVQWLARNQARLLQAGFTMGEIREAGADLVLDLATLSLHSKHCDDWFDIDGTVSLGSLSFPFRQLAPYIRRNDRLFPLPDGRWFVIPAEWMSRYADLTRFAQPGDQSLRINKNQFTLMEHAGIQLPEQAMPTHLEHALPKYLKAELRPYQLEGYRWLVELHHHNLGACLADDMGLGKTLQTIAVLLYAKERKTEAGKVFEKQQAGRQLDLFTALDADSLAPLNALVVLPASLVFNWENELQRFAPTLSIYRHTGIKRHRDMRLLKRFDVILTTYHTVIRDAALLSGISYEYIVLDESQQIKNKDSAAFITIHDLEAAHRISLSGTPIENSLSDLWSQMQFINPDLLGSFSFFKRTFILPIERLGDEDSKAKLKSLVNPFLLRRTKEEVAADLPPLTTQVFLSEMTPDQKKWYEKEKSAARNYLLDQFKEGDARFRMELIQTLTKLRQLVNHPRMLDPNSTIESGKFQDICAKWEEVRKSGHKVLFFSSFVKHLQLFNTLFTETETPFAWLTGQQTREERLQQIRLFEDKPDVKAFFISMKAGGTGLNLTAADYVFILDPWWNPSTEQQAIARAHRIGQDKSVMALKFITRGTIEEKILHLQEKKSQLAEDILSGTGTHQLNRSELNFLLS